jgi:hypothetical protein
VPPVAVLELSRRGLNWGRAPLVVETSSLLVPFGQRSQCSTFRVCYDILMEPSRSHEERWRGLFTAKSYVAYRDAPAVDGVAVLERIARRSVAVLVDLVPYLEDVLNSRSEFHLQRAAKLLDGVASHHLEDHVGCLNLRRIALESSRTGEPLPFEVDSVIPRVVESFRDLQRRLEETPGVVRILSRARTRNASF